MTDNRGGDPGVQPALSPEEWEQWKDAQWISLAPGALSRGPHYVAALALYQQPFGFTREDVTMLRHVEIADYRDEYRRAFDSLAARIAALLPPEEK